MTSVEHLYGVTVLAVIGAIDMLTAPQFEKAIDDVLAEHPQTLLIDLTEVTLLASVGLRLLATANKPSGQSDGFAVVAAAPTTIRPIELTDLNEVFDLYLSLDDAIAADLNEVLLISGRVSTAVGGDMDMVVVIRGF